VFLDAIVVRCVLLPAVLELLGPATWKLPRWLDRRLPEVNIEGTAARARPVVPDEAMGEEEAAVVWGRRSSRGGGRLGAAGRRP
jgi:RND superfamily putative drug exporter